MTQLEVVEAGDRSNSGDSLTWADFHLLHVVDMLHGYAPHNPVGILLICPVINVMFQLLNATPKLEALVARSRALPNIAAWLEQRPRTVL